MEMVLLRDQETSVKLEYIKEAEDDYKTSNLYFKAQDHEMNMEEIRKNFAEVFARQGATLTAIEERSTESDDEELECREFEDFYENGLNMYEETSKHSLKYSTSAGTLLTADSFLENNFIDISTMDGELMTSKVMRYFKRNWWLIYPEGQFKSIWDYLMGMLIVG
jgi:predicted transcriptional regulator